MEHDSHHNAVMENEAVQREIDAINTQLTEIEKLYEQHAAREAEEVETETEPIPIQRYPIRRRRSASLPRDTQTSPLIGPSQTDPEPIPRFILNMDKQHSRAAKQSKGKGRAEDPKANPGRFPAGDTSIDLASINLALGQDVNGLGPMRIDATHGGFPDPSVFAPNRVKGSTAAGAGDNTAASISNAYANVYNSIRPIPHSAGGPFAELARRDTSPTSFFEAFANPLSRPTSATGFIPSPSSNSTTETSPAPGPSNLTEALRSATLDSSDPAGQYSPEKYDRISQDFRDAYRRSAASLGNQTEGAPRGPAFGGFPMQRSTSASPQMAQQQGNGNGANGNGAAMNGLGSQVPISAGQQMDIHIVYQKLQELSEVLRENRLNTQGIVASAEELATRAATSGAGPDVVAADAEISAGRIADLTRQAHNLTNVKQILLREQRENTKLIGEYETALGNIVEMVRDLAYKKDMERHGSAKDYNKRLQEEKDAHLETRLEMDKWHAEAMKYGGMIREAYRLRCEEEIMPIKIVTGLQSEVRGYRAALGIEPEKFEDEIGYPVLKHVKNGAGEP